MRIPPGNADSALALYFGEYGRAGSVPDNPRALVSEACRYEPKLNQTVNDFARHYGVSVLRPLRERLDLV